MSNKFEPRFMRTVLAVSIAAIGVTAQSFAWADDEDDVARLIRPDSEIEVGVGNVSKDSYKFGDYKGLQREGAHLIGNVSVVRRGEDNANYVELEGRNLGLDTRSLSIGGGQQGNYGIRLEYDQISKLWSDSYQTPFTNPGSDSLTLPTGWVRGTTAPTAGVTTGLTQLNASMRPFKIETQRDSIGFGMTKQIVEGWDVEVRGKHEKKEGNRLIAGVIGNSGGNPRAAILPEPVDYTTDEFEALVRYASKKLQLQFGYYGSFFQNANSDLTWRNPFPNSVWSNVDANNGQLSLAPDNHFHQLNASGGYNITTDTRVAGSLSIGRMSQNDAFLPYSVNSGLMATVHRQLPRNSLDGRVDTTHADLKLTSKLLPKLHLTTAYRYDERDNKTPQSQYWYIGGDSQAQTASNALAAQQGKIRTNLPGSSTRQQIDAELDYHWTTDTKLKFGYGYDWSKKTFEAIEDEREHVVKGEVHQHFNDVVSAGFGYAYSDRKTSDYDGAAPFRAGFTDAYVQSQVATGAWDNVPTQYKYFMAPRKRDKVRAFVNVSPNERVDLHLGIDFKDDDYHKSLHGLQRAKGWAANFDVNVVATDALSGHFFTSFDKYSTAQKSVALGGSKANAIDPNFGWGADIADRTYTVGAGFRYKPLRKYEFGGDLTHAASKGQINVWTGPSIAAASQATTPIPELTTRLSRLDLFGQYKLQKDVSLRVKYIYEHYSSKDWAYDQVTANTLGAVIGTNEVSPRYNVHFIGVSVAYQF